MKNPLTAAQGKVSSIKDELTIRSAVAADAPLVLSLIRALAEYERLAHELVATEQALRDTLFGAKPAAEVLLAEWQHQPAGLALFFHNYSTFLGRRGLYLEDLFVLPQFRGHGVGRALLRHLAQLALARDCGRFEWAVLNWNDPAIRFYERLGAREQSDWRIYRLSGPALSRLADGT
jgi:GNAT superfamily N-acetyltransferase